jgi:RHS repeat-associated protein
MTYAAHCCWSVASSRTSNYSGEQYDPDLGLYYLRARYMNPLTGRFMSRDPEDGKPVDPKSLHKYLYAGGDPVNVSDPTGRAELFETGAVLDESAAITAKFTFRIAVLVVNIECAVAAGTEAITKGAHWNDQIPLEADLACLAAAGYGITTEGYALLLEAAQ